MMAILLMILVMLWQTFHSGIAFPRPIVELSLSLVMIQF